MDNERPPETEQEQKKELIQKAKELPLPETFSLRPRTFEEAFRFANLISESTMIPKDFQKQPANVLIAVQLGMELGVSPMQALQSIYVVNGRPAIFGDLLPAIVFASGLCEEFEETGDDTTATCTVKRRGQKPISRTFTWEDAKRAKGYEHGQVISLSEKSTYKSYPKRMLQMRSRSWALRDAFPDVLKGVAVYEEAQDETPSIEIQKEPPIALPQAKQSGTVEDFKARQAEKVTEKGKTNEPAKQDATERGSAGAAKVVAEVIPPQPTDGIQRGPDQGNTEGENANGTDARETAPPDGPSHSEEKPDQAKAGSAPGKKPPERDQKGRIVSPGTPVFDISGELRDKILDWIHGATTEDLTSMDEAKCYVRKVFNTKELLGKLTNPDRALILNAYDAERKARP